MLSIEEALQRIHAVVTCLPPRRLAASAALGLRLAESIESDINSPPHDKSIVDGFAVRSTDAIPNAELEILEDITAGEVPRLAIQPGTCSRIMTGAPIPSEADAVVMAERTELLADRRVRILQSPAPQAGQNIMRRGTSIRRGQTVLAPGTHLRAVEIGLLHEVGRTIVLVQPRPRVGIVVTGNELVPAKQSPAAGQIRNSNGPMLAALVVQRGGEAIDCGVARDDFGSLRDCMLRGLGCDVMLISGGVSAGMLDLVPSVLQSLGVQEVFHKVSLKPGKPLWFGVYNNGSGPVLPVFGLPGNPVSSFVCCELFVRPTIAKLQGDDSSISTVAATLTRDFQHRGERATLYPAALTWSDQNRSEVPMARPLDWRGSGDLRALSEAQGFIYFKPGDRTYAAGELVDVLLL